LAGTARRETGLAAKVGHGLKARKRGGAAPEATREHGGTLAAEAKTEVRRLALH